MSITRFLLAGAFAAAAALNSFADASRSVGSDDSPPRGTDTPQRELSRGSESSGAVSSAEQAASASNEDLAQRVRREIAFEEGLARSAQNVTITTSGGTVTLRGAVESEEERTRMGSIAQRAAGSNRVDNQLEVRAGSAVGPAQAPAEVAP